MSPQPLQNALPGTETVGTLQQTGLWAPELAQWLLLEHATGGGAGGGHLYVGDSRAPQALHTAGLCVEGSWVWGKEWGLDSGAETVPRMGHTQG